MPLLLLLALLDAPIPLAPGTWWVYREAYTQNLQGLDSTEEEETRFSVGGAPGRPFVNQSGGFDPASGPTSQGDGWLVISPWTGEDRLPQPLEVGRSGPPGAAGTPGWTVEAEEEVEVPAGRFRTLRCTLRTPSSVSTLWIAPGVGVVKESHGAPRRRPEIERVLLRWSGGARGATEPVAAEPPGATPSPGGERDTGSPAAPAPTPQK
jgi:hypothetical protein